jgi:AcrR family transcriptional regulator
MPIPVREAASRPASPSRARRARERRDLRARILDAARELLAAEGHEAVTIRRVADRIEHTPPVIYQHFTDKAALIREVCEADWRELRAELARLATIRDPVERLARMGAAYVEFGLTHPNVYRVSLLRRQPDSPADGRWNAETYGALRAAVEEAFEAGRFDPDRRDPALVAQVLWQSLHGIVSMHVTRGQHDARVDYRDPRATSRVCLTALLRGLTRGPPADGRRPPAVVAGGPTDGPQSHRPRRSVDHTTNVPPGVTITWES